MSCKMCTELNFSHQEPVCPDTNCPLHPFNCEPLQLEDFELWAQYNQEKKIEKVRYAY